MNKKVVGIIVSVIILVILFVAWALGGLRLKKDEDVTVVSNKNSQQTHQNSKQPQSDSNVNTNRDKQSQENRENSNKQAQNDNRQSQNSNKTSENRNHGEKPRENGSSNVIPEGEDYSNSVSEGQNLVSKAVENSQVEQDGNKVNLTPTQEHLEDRVYSIAGVVDQVSLYKNSEGTQAQFKLDLKVELEDKTLTLQYFTSANSVSKLRPGAKVTVEYQLTTDKAMVVKSLKDR
ncbi:hypothetical protein P9X10_00505 [Bacillus cereus]|nr:hypothetical protein [Bacillus cereus]